MAIASNIRAGTLKVPAALVLVITLGLQPATATGRDDKPLNFVVILIDDVGIDQLACYDDQNHYTDPLGYPYANTPNIDALASGGVRFNQCRAMPVCSPTRACVLSGRYPFRTGVGSGLVRNLSPDFVEFGVQPAPRETILPRVLGEVGYSSAAVGKLLLGPTVQNSYDAVRLTDRVTTATTNLLTVRRNANRLANRRSRRRAVTDGLQR